MSSRRDEWDLSRLEVREQLPAEQRAALEEVLDDA